MFHDFPEYITDSTQSDHSEKKLFINAKKEIWGQFSNSTLLPWFQNKKNGMIQNSISIHLNPRQTKADQPLENEAKIIKAEMEPK